MSFQHVLADQHRACDAAFARIEEHTRSGDWPTAGQALGDFLRQTEEHFHYEENELFPALEAATRMASQPVAVMRAEHAQIRELADDLRIAIEKRRSDLSSGSLETLLFLLQQHNAKEETVLYALADRALSPDLLPGGTPGTSHRR